MPLQISRYGLFVSKVTGPSMLPTFEGRGDFVIAEAVTPMWGQLGKGKPTFNAIQSQYWFTPRSIRAP